MVIGVVKTAFGGADHHFCPRIGRDHAAKTDSSQITVAPVCSSSPTRPPLPRKTPTVGSGWDAPLPEAGSRPKPTADCRPDYLTPVSLARVLVQFVRN